MHRTTSMAFQRPRKQMKSRGGYRCISVSVGVVPSTVVTKRGFLKWWWTQISQKYKQILLLNVACCYTLQASKNEWNDNKRPTSTRGPLMNCCWWTVAWCRFWYFRFARCSSRFVLSRGCDPARLALWRQFMHTSSLHSDARVNPFLKSFIAVTIGMDAHECVVVSVLARRRPWPALARRLPIATAHKLWGWPQHHNPTAVARTENNNDMVVERCTTTKTTQMAIIIFFI